MNIKEQEIVKKHELAMLKELKKHADSVSPKEQKRLQNTEIWLSEIDRSSIIKIKKRILNSLKKEGVIKSLIFKTEKITPEPPEKPSKLEIEDDALIMDEYQKEEFIYHNIELSSEDEMEIANIKYYPFKLRKYLIKEEIVLPMAGKIELCLEKNGDLWRMLKKEKCCYPMQAKKRNYRVLKFLLSGLPYEYCETDILAIELGITKDQIMKKIGKINEIAMRKLNLNQKLIENKKGSGYRINPAFRIIHKQE